MVNNSDRDAAAKELYTKVIQPTTPIELLKNLKLILENELLLRKDFYEDENLKRFFGGSRIEWFSNRSTFKSVSAKGQTYLYEHLDKYPNRGIGVAWLTTDKDGTEAENGRVKGDGSTASLENPHFTIETVQAVFGTDAEVLTDLRGYYKRLKTRTHELGNKGFAYTFNKPASKASILFLTYGNGQVSEILFKFNEEGE